MSGLPRSGRDPWLEEEARLAGVARRVFARAGRRWRLVLGATLLLSGALLVQRALKKPNYEVTLYFRLAEGEVTDPTVAPRPPRDVRQHIFNVALARHRLEAIMKKYGRSRAWLARDPVAAVDDFRDEIEIDVSRNYFLYDRDRNDEPRSASVTISLAGDDPEQTRAMLHEIGATILDDQLEQRTRRLEGARRLLVTQLGAARERTRSLQDTIERLEAEALTRREREAIALRGRIAIHETEIRGSIEHSLELERRIAALAFSGAAEDERLGLDLQLVDERTATFAPPLEPPEWLLFAAVLLLVMLTLSAPTIGAFDDRVYAPEDLDDCGLQVVGVFPRFQGDDVGSYRATTLARGG